MFSVACVCLRRKLLCHDALSTYPMMQWHRFAPSALDPGMTRPGSEWLTPLYVAYLLLQDNLSFEGQLFTPFPPYYQYFYPKEWGWGGVGVQSFMALYWHSMVAIPPRNIPRAPVTRFSALPRQQIRRLLSTVPFQISIRYQLNINPGRILSGFGSKWQIMQKMD